MKKLLPLLFLFAAAFGIYWFKFRNTETPQPEAPKPKPIEITNNSSKIDVSVDSIIATYLNIKNAFVEADAISAKSATKNLVDKLDNFPFKELQKDTSLVSESVKSTIDNIKANATSLLSQTDITEMRHDFNGIFENLYPLFKVINYKGQKLFVQKCPMAFGDDMPASWISNNAEIVNPYLGKIHPTYKATMLHCGEVVDSVLAK